MTRSESNLSPDIKTSLSGLSAAPGFAVGPLVIKQEQDLQLPEPYPCEDPQAAWQEIAEAITEVKRDLQDMQQKVAREIGEEEAAIFLAHQSIVEDVALQDQVTARLKEGVNPEAAWHQSVEKFAAMLEDLPDPTLQARAADVRDVGRQVLARLLGQPAQKLVLNTPSVIAARDLTPTETAKLDKNLVLAFCTAEGGKTSHTAILAKALGIPAVVALGAELMEIPAGAVVLVDGSQGKITVRPSGEEKAVFLKRQAQAEEQFQHDLAAAGQPAVTRDGIQVEIAANIGGVDDALQAVEYGAEAVGLFRTEFLYLDRPHLPSLEEQIKSYQQVIRILEGRPLVVRTLDIGGDKQVDYLGIEEEPNPFLGWRAVRMLSERPEVLEDQLYALLVAGAGTDLRIMIPLVSRLDEVAQSRELLDRALARVKDDHPGFSIQLQFGIMVEVPSAALMVPQISPLVDFFSIGTNDLTQYTLAVDRMNARVSSLASPFHPAVLQLITRTITDAHREGKWVGMCGEFAGNPLAVPFLLGAGLDELSMAPRSIPEIKRLVRGFSRDSCRELIDSLLGLNSAAEVKAQLDTYQRENLPKEA